MDSDERIRRSDVVIDTGGTMEETGKRALDAWARMKARVGGAG
jgi:dephospho-CoA kinase